MQLMHIVRLAVVHSKEENDFLKTLDSVDCGGYLGLKWEGAPASWDDGSLMTYENWAEEEPRQNGHVYWRAHGWTVETFNEGCLFCQYLQTEAAQHN